MISQWAALVVRYRIAVLLASIIVIALSVAGLKKLYFESSTDLWFLENDPVLVTYNTMKERFGSDDYLVVGVQAAGGMQDVLNPETMIAIKKITDFLEEHVAVNKVRSINKFEYIHYVDDMLDVDQVIPTSTSYNFADSEWNRIRSILRKEEIAHGLLFTKDLKHTVISARVVEEKDYTGPDNAKKDLAGDFRVFVEKEGLNNNDAYKLYFSGSSVISESFFHYSTLDQSISYPLMMLFVLIFLYLIFRTWMGTLLPFAIMTFSSIVALGVVGFSGWSMNMLNIIIPTILTVIALGNAIHILMGFYDSRSKGLPSREAATESIKTYFKPCLYASMTTMFGFLALASSKLALVVEFGLEMAAGVAAAFLFSLTTLPAILSYSNAKGKDTARLSETGYLARTIHHWPEKIINLRKTILVAMAVSILPVLYFCTQVEVDTNFVRNFKEDAPIRQGLNYFDQTYKGSLSLEFMLDSGKEDGAKDPGFLQRALEFQNYVQSLEGTGKANSMVNYLMKINQVMNEDNEQYFRVPETRNMVAQYLLLYSSSGPDEDLTDLLTFNGRYIRVSVPFEVAPSKITKERVEQIETHINKHFSDLNIETSGRAVLFNNMDTYVLEGLTSSFGLAFIIISICFFVLFRSFKYGLLALIPNVMPILVAGAVMGLLGIYLDFATLMVAATTLGIAVDDTIHFMNRYVNARRENASNTEAVTLAIHKSGPAILSTTVILTIGFSMLMLSSFVPNFYMGFIGVIVILLALVGDMVILPALVTSRSPKKNRAGDEPANVQTGIYEAEHGPKFAAENQ